MTSTSQLKRRPRSLQLQKLTLKPSGLVCLRKLYKDATSVTSYVMWELHLLLVEVEERLQVAVMRVLMLSKRRRKRRKKNQILVQVRTTIWDLVSLIRRTGVLGMSVCHWSVVAAGRLWWVVTKVTDV